MRTPASAVFKSLVAAALLCGHATGESFYLMGHTGEIIPADSIVPPTKSQLLEKAEIKSDNLTFNIVYLDPAGKGFNDNTHGANRRKVVEAVLAYMNSVLSEPGGVCEIHFQPSTTSGDGFLASAGSYYNIRQDYLAGATFEHITTGIDPIPTHPDMICTVDFGYRWNNTLNAPRSNEYDLYSVLLHEITHGLGITSLSTASGGTQFAPTRAYTTWDNMLYTDAGTKVWHASTRTFQGGSLAAGDNKIRFGGSAARNAFPGTIFPPVYTPNPFETGSSVSHWQQSSPIPEEAVMRPIAYLGESTREYQPFEIGALADLGYEIAQKFSPDALALPSTWYLAEGATHARFETYYLIANPNDETLQVDIEYLPESAPAIQQVVMVPANSRYTIKANDIIPNQGLSAAFRAPSGKGFAVERSMYSIGASNRWHGAHATVGIPAPKPEWFLAEGASSVAGPAAGPFQTFVLLANPNAFAVDVVLTYYPAGGAAFDLPYRVAAKSRRTVEPGKEDARLADTSFSTRAKTIGNHGILVERAMWWRASNWPADSPFMEGTVSPGVSELSKTWYLAEGNTSGFDDFILLVNPSNVDASVQVRYFLESAAPITRTFIVGANQRRTINVRWDAEGLGLPDGTRHGTMVTSSVAVAMERSMYISRAGYGWVAGHNSIGSTGLSTKWLLPEGATVPVAVGNLQTEILIVNPNAVPSTVEVRFLLSGGGTHSENFTIPAQRRHTIIANNIAALAAKAFSTVVLSSEPVVVERSMYFDTDNPADISPVGGTCSMGIPGTALFATPKLATTTKGAAAAMSDPSWMLYQTPTPTPSVTPTPTIE